MFDDSLACLADEIGLCKELMDFGCSCSGNQSGSSEWFHKSWV